MTWKVPRLRVLLNLGRVDDRVGFPNVDEIETVPDVEDDDEEEGEGKSAVRKLT